MFCFIDQMPKPARSSLLLKDDDWRMSLFMGNYITLTNVGEDEFQRIIKRRASPLYISIHATDPDVRVRLMGNPSAGNLMGRLTILKENDLRFHGQIVLCPGVNDSGVLRKSLEDLMALYPSSQSVAVVPVGLTKHRLGLAELTVPGKSEASDTIDLIEEFQRQSMAKNGTSFVFASDEFYILAERELPPYESYEDFPQLENGVGLLRKFEHELIEELKNHEPLPSNHILDGATGFSAAPFLQKLFERLEPYGIRIRIHPIRNDYFGDQITVAGLVTASDMIKQLKGGLPGEKLLIPGNMLRENEPVFLDNITLAELKKTLETDIIPMSPYDGGAFIESLFAMYEKGSANE
jgi:putative radical SAM enzyme (TIGR03279 family)